MPFVTENIRLRELAIVANSNRPMFNDFVSFLTSEGYSDLHDFVMSADSTAAKQTFLRYFQRNLPIGVALYDGIARPYAPDKAKWLLLGWIFRDAPEQRLRPMLKGIAGNSLNQRRVTLLNEIREYMQRIFPEKERWTWVAISEVIIDRLEGSRRAIKGTLFEAIVRTQLEEIFSLQNLDLSVSKAEVRLAGETYDVEVIGRKGTVLLPVKTRETMGGGHALLFTRDIHKSISVAHRAGFECIPIVIAESWGGDIASLECRASIYIDKNPNQIAEVRPLLATELELHLNVFRAMQ
ncbi:hypothetical protein [Acetobacter malorum]|uniref:hypothetical protein n=1 Tax=Acetobacter malorum TaxID=178901 RepID=UPI0039E94C40